MENQYSVFKKYPTVEQVQEVIRFLNKNDIETQFGENSSSLDSNFLGSSFNNEFEIKIKESDFEKANQILEKIAENQINEVDSDYYLFSFSNEELFDILLKQDEWNEFDYSLSKKILNSRGKSVDFDMLKSLKKQRLEDLAKPEENQKLWIVAGYFFALLGGLLGVIIGYVIMTSKKTLPNGKKVFSYNENDRIQGKIMFYIGIIMLPFYIILKILSTN
jgi:ABC-type lipoprotein release transport system permease subunit